MNATLTTADLIGQYIRLRAKVAQMTEEFDAKLAPYKNAMKILEATVGAQIEQLGGESIKTEQGTAYRSTVLAVKMVDRVAFLNFVFENRADSYLTSAVAKEPVKEYLETNQTPPPGLEVTFVHNINFRKAS